MKQTYEQRWRHERTKKTNGSKRKEKRKEDAFRRGEEWNKLDIKQKLSIINKRPGSSKKERKRLELLETLIKRNKL
jgi:hypothetical protein